MQISEIINILHKELTRNFPMEEYKYNDIINGSITKNRYFIDDKILSSMSLEKVLDISIHIYEGKMLNNIHEEIDSSFLLDRSLKLSEYFMSLLNQFEKIELWAEKTYQELSNYLNNKSFLKNDIKEALELSFSDDINILNEVLLNYNIFSDDESRKKALEILDQIDNFNEDNHKRLEDLIAEQIANKLSFNPDILNYQWYKILQNKELKIQRYDELKSHDFFHSLF